MAKPLQYTEVYTLKITKTQAETLVKLRDRNIKIANFVRKAIQEKINREYEELKPKPPKIKCPF